MPWTAFAFLAGDALFQQLPLLPDSLTLALVGAFLVVSVWIGGTGRWPWLLAGWLWAAGFALWHQPTDIPEEQLGSSMQVRFTIVGLPASRKGSIRFVAELVPQQGTTSADTRRVRLSWRHAPDLRVGQVWQASIRLRPAHSYRNPGSWDYAGWLYRQGIRFTGYVTRGDARLVSQEDCCWANRMREWLRDRLARTGMSNTGLALVQALTIGDRSGIDSHMREVAAVTGISHLLAISGLHISLIGGIVGFVLASVWRNFAVCRRIPAALAGSWAGLVAAGLYAVLSGFGLPAQRALLMLAVAVLLLWTRRTWRPWNVFGYALLLVLLFDPMAVLDAGFWLSFVAVGAILAVIPHCRERPWWQAGFVIQAGIALALYPVLIGFDMPVAPFGLLINLVLVPVFTMLVIPGVLVAVVVLLVPAGTDGPLLWVAQFLDRGWQGLEWAAHWTGASWRPEWSPEAILALGVGALLVLAAPGVRSRSAGLVLLVATHLPANPSLEPGSFQVDVLDVGQGLAAVVRTRNHSLIYDTGAAYASGFNLADAVVIPWLRHRGLRRADILILSHGDNDHAGAAPQLYSKYRVERVFSGEPGRVGIPASPCPSQYYWQWDGVIFGFVQPQEAAAMGGNNSSCVLLVSGKGGRFLITGDAEKRIERVLADTFENTGPIDVVVAGHHGSNTSSSAGFVSAVKARHVIYSAGYRNRYGFPKPIVDNRWAKAGVRRWRTDGCGTITLQYSSTRRPGGPEPISYSPNHLRYWDRADVPCEMTTPPPSSMMRASKIK